ncbi:hypothetical protein ACSSS7_008450 [Eimeria intestinalis]
MINGDPVSEAQFAESHRRVVDAAKAVGATLTFFECCTLIAFDIFASTEVEWAVVETGLGGRLDATNILKDTKCCVITSIGQQQHQHHQHHQHHHQHQHQQQKQWKKPY